MKTRILFLCLSLASSMAFAQNVGIGNTDPKAKLDVSGDFILKSATLTLLDGNTLDLDVNTNKYNHYKLIGPTGNFQIGGIAAVEHDRIITLYNRSGHSLEVYNDDVNAVASNRILTGTGTTFAVYPGGSVTLKYDIAINKWEITASHYNSLDNFGSGNWTLSGNDIFNANVGNVGINTVTPLTNLQVDGNFSLVSDTILGPCSSIVPPINNNNVLINNTIKKKSVFHLLKDPACNISFSPYLLGIAGGTDGQIVTVFMHISNSQVKHLTGMTSTPTVADSANMIELYEPNFNGSVNQPSQLTFNTGGAITLIYDSSRARWKPINYYGEIKSESFGWLKGGGPNSIINPNGGDCKVGIGLYTPSSRLEVANTTNNEVAIKGWSTGIGGTAAHFSSSNGNAIIVDQGNVGLGINAPNAKLSVTRGTGLDGTAALFGTDHVSHFNQSTDEHTFIRGGKNGSRVVINDGLLGNVGIGLGPEHLTVAKFLVYQPIIESNSNSHVLQLRGQNPIQFFSDQFNTTRGYIKGVTNTSATPQFNNVGIEIGAAGNNIYLTSAGYLPALTVNGSTNYIGIGQVNPAQTTSPLSFPNILGNKISFWSAGVNNEYGIGLQSGKFQIYTAGQDQIAFGWGGSNNFNQTMTFYPGTGQLGINALPLAGYHLSVNGSIKSKEVVVETAGWPDYVFTKDYNLLSLSDIEKFIHKNGHLPNIPSAKVMEENGQALGDTQKKMMEKIEELTLYIIQLNKEVELLRNNQNK